MAAAVLLALLTLAILWGSAFPVIKIGLEDLGVAHLTLLRHLVASLCFVPVLALFRQRLLPARRDMLGFILLGTIGIAVYHLALNAGELRVSAGATSLIIAAAPGLTALLAWLLLDDRLPFLGWLGSGISFAGVALIVAGDARSLGAFDPWALFIVLSAASAALYFVLQKPYFGRYSAVEVTAFATWGGTLPMLLLAPGLGAAISEAAAPSLLAALYLGVFPSAIAYSMLAYALSKAPVTLVSAYLYTIPLFSLLFSWLLIGEVPAMLTIVGGAVVLLGVMLVNVAKQGRLVRRGFRTASTPPAGAPATAPRKRLR